MATLSVAGFSIVRNATLLDFPLEASVASVLPVVDEFVLAVGRSDDDTLDRARAIGDPKVRIVETTWDSTRGIAVLADETSRALAACRAPWAIYIQADEVFADGAADRVRAAIDRADADSRVEGIIVDYRHFYGGFDTLAANRKWYRREIRAVRTGREYGIRSYGDAQGFRAGDIARRVRCMVSDAVMHHYGWARPAQAIAAKRAEDAAIDPIARRRDAQRAPLPWIPGLRPFIGEHPAVAREWIAARNDRVLAIAPRRLEPHHLRLAASGCIERVTGWRPFEYRNYTVIEPR
jgi:hypothetical protein